MRRVGADCAVEPPISLPCIPSEAARFCLTGQGVSVGSVRGDAPTRSFRSPEDQQVDKIRAVQRLFPAQEFSKIVSNVHTFSRAQQRTCRLQRSHSHNLGPSDILLSSFKCHKSGPKQNRPPAAECFTQPSCAGTRPEGGGS